MQKMEQEKVLGNKKMKVTNVNHNRTENISDDERKDNKGNKYNIYNSDDNFCSVIPSGENLDGNAYYKVPKNAKKLKLIYSLIMEKV